METASLQTRREQLWTWIQTLSVGITVIITNHYTGRWPHKRELQKDKLFSELPRLRRRRMESPGSSSSSWGRWLPEPWGWPPSASSEPAPAAASEHHAWKQSEEEWRNRGCRRGSASPRTSFAFCFRRSCSGSSCRARDWNVKRKTTLIAQMRTLYIIYSCGKTFI